ncbi:glutathione S-transferase [Cyathus striatus]|nr:glutathione S-transferase [Cyathus striatus]
MVLKLYGNTKATCTTRVAVVLHEKKVPFEFHNIDLMKGEQKSPEFLKHQPFGVVPYIDDDGFILYESRAIARYISMKYASQGTQDLIPTSDVKRQALFEQAASIEVSNFDPYASQAVRENLFKKLFGQTPDLEIYNKNIETLTAKLDVYDKILSKQKYMAGDSLTLVDLFHLPYANLLAAAGSNVMLEKPNVARWFNDIKSRPAWKAVENGVEAIASYD